MWYVGVVQDRTNALTLAGPNRLSSNDLLCSLLWHVICIVRPRTEVDKGTFFFPMDLRQMHVPDDYFGNAQCIQAVSGMLSLLLLYVPHCEPLRKRLFGMPFDQCMLDAKTQ